VSKRALDNKEYLEITYSDTRAPQSSYPIQLGKHLLSNFYKRTGKVLDIGCGRGDSLRALSSLGFNACGVDISPEAPNYSKDFNVKVLDLEKEELSYENEFDFVFSKSVIEHMREPVALIQASYKSLKKGGMSVIMTPSWEHNYKGAFYIDHTHVTPFTRTSLKDIMEMSGFKDVEVYYFYQLPYLWRYPFLKLLSKIVSMLPIPYAPLNQVPWKVSNELNKFVRFSKEIMLLAVAKK